MMNHIGTHDTVRAITRLAGESSDYRDREWQSSHKLSFFEYSQGIERLKLAAALQYTLPGVPSVYYGDEAGLQGYRGAMKTVSLLIFTRLSVKSERKTKFSKRDGLYLFRHTLAVWHISVRIKTAVLW